MRLWTLHPRYLDRQGLLASWRESLLALAVLQGKTRGYTHHPQLTRFRALRSPVAGMGAYLAGILAEAGRRGYHFDHTKVPRQRTRVQIPTPRGQLLYEWQHLRKKLQARSPNQFREIAPIAFPDAHPLFAIKPGNEPCDWERPTREWRT